MLDTPEKKAPPPILMANRPREWALALILHLTFFILMLEYHRWRGRSYTDSLGSFLFVGNKAAGIASVFSLSAALALGPLCRRVGLPSGFLRLRRPLGVTGAVGSLPHVLVSLFFLDRKFDWTYYARHWISTGLGAMALLGFLWLAAISWPWSLRRFTPERWKAWQRLGFILIAIVFLHAVVFTGKLANWPDWFAKIGRPGNAPVPPGSFVIGLAVASVLALKAADAIAARRRKP